MIDDERDIKGTPDDDRQKKGKQRHRLLVNPQELGLTARIRKAILDQDLGITQRIKRAVEKTQDVNSFFYMKRNHFIMIGVLLFVVFLLGFFAFRSRDLKLELKYPDGRSITADLHLAFYHLVRDLEIPAYARQITFERFDIYGSDLGDKDFWITTKDDKKVDDPRNLLPGVYTLHVKKEGYKDAKIPLAIGDVRVKIPVALDPVVEPKRELRLYLNDPLMTQDLEPDDVRILGSNKSIKNIQIKPGKYAVVIERSGYHPKETEINIPENGVIADKITLDYKKRAAKFIVEDGLYQKGFEPVVQPQEITLVQEGKQIPFTDSLMPGWYDLDIRKDGYEPYKERLKITAGGTMLTLSIPLKPMEREIRVVPNYDIAPPDLKPDKAYMKDLLSTTKEVIPLSEGLRVKPGEYWVTVEKANYHAYGSKIFIEPSSKSYEVKAHLISVVKLVMLKIRSDFDVEPSVNPDEMMIDMRMGKVGYVPVEWGKLKQSLPPEKKEIEVPVFLETIPRRVVAEITSDITTGFVTPDLLTITRVIEGRAAEQSLEIKGGENTTKPGRYFLTIKKAGYDDIKEEVIIYPSDRPYVLRYELKARRVPLVLKLDSDYDPGIEVRPDEIKINNEPAKLQNALKPGTYTVYVQKNGFYPIEKRVKIDPSGEDYTFAERFKTKPRRVVFRILGGEVFGTIDPDLVTFDRNTVKENTEVPPKKEGYEVKIEKRGFDTLRRNVIIDPSENPYELTATLNVLKRKVEVLVTATFPKGLNLSPLDECTLTDAKLGSKIIIGTDTEVVPGKYHVSLIKNSYKPINKTIMIDPDAVPFQYREVMEPKPREVRSDLSYDVQPEDSKQEKLVRMVSKDGTIDKSNLKDGDMIDPNEYKLEITVPAYKKVEEQVTVPPSESAYLLKYTLESLPRNVILNITAEYPPGKTIIPDKVLFNGEPFSADVAKLSNTIKPGQYSVVIDKAGYHSIKKQISILAGTTDYTHVEQMITMPRLVISQLYNSETKKELIPSRITMGNEAVTQSNSFKPGKYRLFIQITGYPEVSEDIEIEPGVEPYIVRRGMLPSSRPVDFEIRGDYNMDKLSPTEITLNGKSLLENKAFAPGPYDLVVYVPGYERLVKRIDIGPSLDPFTVREELKSKKRKVVFKITGTFNPGVPLQPNKVTFDNKDLLEGEEIKPKSGGYRINVEKEGYSPFSENVVVEPSEKAFTLEVNLGARPRRLEFEVDSDYKPGVLMQLDTIQVDGTDFKTTEPLAPGPHKIAIKKIGYERQEFQEVIDPGIAPFKIKKTLVSLPRPILVKAMSDFSNTLIEKLDLCTLGERKVDGETFKPGHYELALAHSGYLSIREKVEILPGENAQEFNKTMVAKKRKIMPNIIFDRAPVPESAPHVIRMSSGAEPVAVRVEPGDEMKPGEYNISIEKEGYETFHGRWVIEPNDKPAQRDFEMISKMVEILIEVTYDIEAPATLPPYTVTFIDPQSGIGRHVSHGKKIKPGNYLLEVSRAGYEFKTPKKKIYVPPVDKPYWVKEKLFAKPRTLSFEMTHGTVLVRAKEMMINNKEVKAEDTFMPGQEYKLTAKFQDYKTATRTIVIPPGEAPYVVDLQLVKLEKFEFSIAKRFFETGKGMVVDDIRYNLEIYVDGEQVEPHHILCDEQSTGFSMVYGAFYAYPQARSVKFVGAFFFDESLIKKNMALRDLRRIEGMRLVEHLRELAKTTPNKALTCMSRLVSDKQDKDKVKDLSADDLERIINILRDLELPSPMEQELRNKTVKKLQEK